MSHRIIATIKDEVPERKFLELKQAMQPTIIVTTSLGHGIHKLSIDVESDSQVDGYRHKFESAIRRICGPSFLVKDAVAVPDHKAPLYVINEHIEERAAAGVLLAKSVARTTISDGDTGRTVEVTVNPELVDLNNQQLLGVSAFDNLAEFFGLPLGWDTQKSADLREAIGVVRTQFEDGSDAGSMTSAELYRIGTGRASL